jgi:hypothetical protein
MPAKLFTSVVGVQAVKNKKQPELPNIKQFKNTFQLV